MRLVFSLVALAAVAQASAACAQPDPAGGGAWARYPHAREVQLRGVAGFVRIVPQTRTDIAVSIVNPGPLPAPELRMARDRLVIDGDLHVRGCAGQGEDFHVDLRDRGRIRAAQLPVIELRVPRAAVVSANGALRLSVGASESLRLRFGGCGDADVEAVAGEVSIALSGSPGLRLYQAGSARVAVAGDGDVVLGALRNGLTASIAGAGDLTAAHVDGPTSIAVQGAGDVIVRDGRAPSLSVVIAGAGDVVHNGVAGRLDVTVVGAGDVRVRRVEGEINRRIIGAGEVHVAER